MIHTLIEKAFFLKQLPLFQDLDLDILLAVADKLEEIEAAPDALLFYKGQEATHVYFLVSGAFEVIDRDDITLNTVHLKGEMIGDESIFNERDREYTVKCVEPSKFLAITKSHIFSLISENPTVCAKFLALYSSLQKFRRR